MVDLTLTQQEYALLERLRAERRIDASSEVVDGEPSAAGATDGPSIDTTDDEGPATTTRFDALADNGLVEQTENDAYRLTESGRRVLESRTDDPSGHAGDLPPDVERAIEGFDADPASKDAVRRSFTFLRYWGEATAAEIVDAVYSERPAGRTDRREWWDGLVADRLAAVPGVTATERDGTWRYRPTASDADDASNTDADDADDGRAKLSDVAAFGSGKHAIERMTATETEAEQLSCAFGTVSEQGSATAREIEERCGATARRLAERLLDELPAVERTGDETWTYSN